MKTFVGDFDHLIFILRKKEALKTRKISNLVDMKSILVPLRKCLIVLAICSILSDISKKRMIISVF